MKLVATTVLICLISASLTQKKCAKRKRPNIVVIIGDDMGHNDFGFRGSNQIPTPNIDALGYHGIILDKYYVQNSCTPSRAAFLTGNYPIRSGMQGFPIVSGQNRSLPLDMPLMSEHLKRLGYQTHIVGKWHLGSAYRKNTPTRRGFDTHFGYWNGFLGYFDYLTDYNNTKIEGFDLRDKFRPAWEYSGQYATDVFTNKALEVIDNHDSNKPMFLLVTHLAAHAGRDSIELGVPDRNLTDQKYTYIPNIRRRLYADIVNRFDQSVGTIVKRLAQRKMLKDSIILFFSDNGAPTIAKYANSGSNWPLRGIKLTNFEGAIRGTATIFSPLFKKKGYVNNQLIHVTDWLPTFYAAAGGDVTDLGFIDGINQWNTLSQNARTKRREILVDISELQNVSSIITDGGRYKLVTGTILNGSLDGYFGDSGRNPNIPAYNITQVMESDVHRAIQTVGKSQPSDLEIVEMREQIDLAWCRFDNFTPFLNCTGGCLFDLVKDPCETRNIIGEYPDIAQKLSRRIEKYSVFLVPQGSEVVDPRANPQRFNNTWCTWLDDSWCVSTPNNTNLI